MNNERSVYIIRNQRECSKNASEHAKKNPNLFVGKKEKVMLNRGLYQEKIRRGKQGLDLMDGGKDFILKNETTKDF